MNGKTGMAIVWIAGVFALIGLISGHLWIPTRNNGIDVTGNWARLVSAGVLAFVGLLLYLKRKEDLEKAESEKYFPDDQSGNSKEDIGKKLDIK